MLERLSIDFAREQRDAAITRVAAHADEDAPGWTDVALQFLARYAAEHELFASEDVTEAARAWGLVEPPDARAWGAVYLRAQRQRLIERSNVTYQRRFGHASVGLKWRSRRR